jgi:hypothetical protein
VSISTTASPETLWVTLDVYRDSITSAVLEPGREVPAVNRWFHDEPNIRRFVSNLGEPALRFPRQSRHPTITRPSPRDHRSGEAP